METSIKDIVPTRTHLLIRDNHTIKLFDRKSLSDRPIWTKIIEGNYKYFIDDEYFYKFDRNTLSVYCLDKEDQIEIKYNCKYVVSSDGVFSWYENGDVFRGLNKIGNTNVGIDVISAYNNVICVFSKTEKNVVLNDDKWKPSPIYKTRISSHKNLSKFFYKCSSFGDFGNLFIKFNKEKMKPQDDVIIPLYDFDVRDLLVSKCLYSPSSTLALQEVYLP